MQHCIPFCKFLIPLFSLDAHESFRRSLSHSFLPRRSARETPETPETPQFFSWSGFGTSGIGLERQILALHPHLYLASRESSTTIPAINPLSLNHGGYNTFSCPTTYHFGITLYHLGPRLPLRPDQIVRDCESRIILARDGIHRKDSTEGKLVLHNTHEQETTPTVKDEGLFQLRDV